MTGVGKKVFFDRQSTVPHTLEPQFNTGLGSVV